MIAAQRRAILTVGLGIYVLGLGFLGGVAIERLRFDGRRAAVLDRYEEAAAHWRALLIRLEHDAARDDDVATTGGDLDTAPGAGGFAASKRAVDAAYGAAIRSRRWERLTEVGDAYVRLGDRAGARLATAPQARRAYLDALLLARRDGSPEGVLRVAEAFDALGDRAVVEQCLRIAEGLAAQSRDEMARARVRAAVTQWGTDLATAERPSPAF
jgi:hypothetical protein